MGNSDIGMQGILLHHRAWKELHTFAWLCLAMSLDVNVLLRQI